MNCPFCEQEYTLKDKWLAKNCHCDDEERFIKYEDWYLEAFNKEVTEKSMLFTCHN